MTERWLSSTTCAGSGSTTCAHRTLPPITRRMRSSTHVTVPFGVEPGACDGVSDVENEVRALTGGRDGTGIRIIGTLDESSRCVVRLA